MSEAAGPNCSFRLFRVYMWSTAVAVDVTFNDIANVLMVNRVAMGFTTSLVAIKDIHR